MNLQSGYPLDAYDRAGFTPDVFMRLAEQGLFRDAGKVELIRGSIERMAPPPSLDHARYNADLVVLLGSAYRGKPLSLAIDLGVQVAEMTVRAPDVAVVRPGASPDGAVASEFILLLVEIAASSQQRDLIEKAGEYATALIPHYWVVDLDGRVTHVFRNPVGGAYTKRMEVPFGGTLDVPETDRTIVIV